MVGLPTKEVVKKTIEQLAQGIKFNDIEIPGGESVVEYVERQHSFFKVVFQKFRNAYMTCINNPMKSSSSINIFLTTFRNYSPL